MLGSIRKQVIIISYWTYINGTVIVSPMGRTQAEKRYILDTVLEHLPLVTGSEKDMNVYVIQKKGYNSLSSCDEFGQVTNNLVDRYGDKSRRRGSLRTQDEYILVVNGSFRDRMFEQTYREFQKWICRLAKRVDVEDVLVEVKGWKESALIRNPSLKGKQSWETVYGQMNEKPTWLHDKKSFSEPNWCEFMLYDRAKNSDYPMLLEYKYFADEENDKEVERRISYLRK